LFALVFVLSAVFTSGPASAATSASITFDFVSDPGDLADGPDYNIVGSGLVDDGGSCDVVVVVMLDATGTYTDIDTICLNLGTGAGGSDGDYGSMSTRLTSQLA
jgi:hypothetical protein